MSNLTDGQKQSLDTEAQKARPNLTKIASAILDAYHNGRQVVGRLDEVGNDIAQFQMTVTRAELERTEDMGKALQAGQNFLKDLASKVMDLADQRGLAEVTQNIEASPYMVG